MLSRILSREAVKSIRPFTWQAADSSGNAENECRKASEPNSAAVRQALAIAEEPVLLLQARVAELEGMIQKRVQESRDAGYREGVTAGKNQASAEVKLTMEKLAQSIHHLSECRPMLRDQAEADIVRLALAIARRVLNRELNTDPDSIVGLVKVALSKLRLQEVIRVRVHPSHQKVLKELLSRSGSCPHIEITSDPAIELGGLLFETSRGEFDASVDIQLKEIERGLTDRLAK
jgi:flagellar assembly protein FliH